MTVQFNVNRPRTFILPYFNVFQVEVGIFHYFVVKNCLLPLTNVTIF